MNNTAREFWIIVDRPRWSRFPFLFRTKSFYGQTCEYYEACDKLIKVKDMLPPRWSVSLGVTQNGGIYVYE